MKVWISLSSSIKLIRYTWWKSKHRKCNTTAEYYQKIASDVSYLIRRKWTRVMCLIFTHLGCYAAMRIRKKIHYIDDLRKRLVQTWFEFEQRVIDASINQWRNRLRSRAHAGGGHWTHALKWVLIIWFIRTFCETANVIWRIWRLFCG